jgi:hypothetical protein
MRYGRDLQVELRNRYARLVQTGWETYDQEIRIIANWMLKQPALKAILDDATAVKNLEAGEWVDSLHQHGGWGWPEGVDDQRRAALVWTVFDRIADGQLETRTISYSMFRHSQFDENVREFTKSVAQHLFDFLGEALGSASEMLHLLERYKRQFEWFDRQRLYDAFLLDTQQGEHIYDTHLRQFLFSNGVDYPFTQSRGPSGDTDVLAGLDGDDALVCEVKLFDGKNAGKRAVATGVNQAVQYAQDYGKSLAYLVVIDLSGRGLAFPSDAPAAEWPARLQIAGVTVHLLEIRALPLASASKRGKSKPVSFTRRDLTDPDAD